MLEFIHKGRLGNQKIVDLIRLLSRAIDMWLVLIIYELLYVRSGSRIIALMGIAFCMILNYLVILFPKEIYLKIPRRIMVLLFCIGRMGLILGLIWKAYYHINFVILIGMGLALSIVTALSNGLVILYRKPVSADEKFHQMARRIIYLTVPLIIGYTLYVWMYRELTIYYILYVTFTVNLLMIPMIPLIKYNSIVTYDASQLEFTIDGLIMCAIEYLVRVLIVVVFGFAVPAYIGVIMYGVVIGVVIAIALYKNDLVKHMKT